MSVFTYLVYRLLKALFMIWAIANLSQGETTFYSSYIFISILTSVAVGLAGSHFINRALLDYFYLRLMVLPLAAISLIGVFLGVPFFGFQAIFFLSVICALDVILINSDYYSCSAKNYYVTLLIFSLLIGGNFGLTVFLYSELVIRMLAVISIIRVARLYDAPMSLLYSYSSLYGDILRKSGISYLVNAVMGMSKLRILEYLGLLFLGVQGSVAARVVDFLYSLSGVVSNRLFVNHVKIHKLRYIFLSLQLLGVCLVFALTIFDEPHMSFMTSQFELIRNLSYVPYVILILSVFFIFTTLVYKFNSVSRSFGNSIVVHSIEFSLSSSAIYFSQGIYTSTHHYFYLAFSLLISLLVFKIYKIQYAFFTKILSCA